MGRNHRRPVRAARPLFVVRFTLGDRILPAGQRLRADETVVATTLALRYAAARQTAGRQS